MTTTKTPEQSERVQLDILNELADVRARLVDAERAKADVWDEGYKAGNVDGYFETREEKNPYRQEDVVEESHRG
ncbi:hypothetical protein [Agromyces sp. NBRC 114283]|uniref:hypothetical protein n=1 Tax=Agromyces sp. NBRC 114283 TaxID=2994521 RepID=UPI00249FAA0C|nr:hypothetical protein [Agromyces sp. NBRC 114283]GLU91328.1 hypothetical protein Agsp01_35830 [Agromyces sp. NBRC 114283]